MKALLQNFLSLIFDISHSRRLILELTLRDIKARYLGSYLGILWAFIQPATTILVFWFVFDVGFRTAPVDNFPFILWLITGMIPWFFVSDSISGATESIIGNSYLVNKVVFRVSILPVIRILSSLAIHLVFIVIMAGMFYLYDYRPSMFYLQTIYYLIAACILITGIAWVTSSLVIFLKDMTQVVGMLLQFAFWLTPIFWPISIIPLKYQPIIRMNPFYYIVEGYRSSFIYGKWFWEDSIAAFNFWVIALTVFVVGAILFRRLRPHFADML